MMENDKIVIEEGGTYMDGNNIIWDEPDFSKPPVQIMEGTVTLKNGKEQTRRFLRDGKYWANGAPTENDLRNLVRQLDTEAVTLSERVTSNHIEDDMTHLPNPLKPRMMGQLKPMHPNDKLWFSHDRYNQLVEETFEKIKELGKLKGGEYAGDFDRLANFRRNGMDLELPMETIWRVYAGKHWDAIRQYIVDLQSGNTRTRSESISGRVDDLIVYLLLFKAMVEEREG